MMQSWKMASAKDNEQTGQEEDRRDEAEGGIDRWATAGSAVWEKHTVINYKGYRNYNYTSQQRVAGHFSFPQLCAHWQLCNKA